MGTTLGIVCILAGFAAAAAQVAGRDRTHVTAKMTAATAYLGFAVALGAPASSYGQWVLVALAFSWLGDLFLTGGARRSFLLGLGSFLLAHIAYVVAFTVRGITPGAALLGGAVMAAVGALVIRWLVRAGLPTGLRVPVLAYVGAIGLMVALAAGAAWGPATVTRGTPPSPAPGVLAGAILFAASDILVARQRFVRPEPVNRLVGLPLYFTAQLLLAASVA
ncbi:MAG: hypothetical protein GWM90_31895 [Gemmatimonadetes bacterium]|nr:lysoplasmalogenase [Gemmatimonadota bacterium]NIU80074.1 hypothetical protein [Gammaproteobacteria bacterium]NIV59264.1 hypothetical protein [Actinomycetota bacterium]NIQ59873.1 lysoplasmalogenase [Gemmatimonadota bacterium]NIW37936.1 hypothetical protein [Gemmatimonadota bacterium]